MRRKPTAATLLLILLAAACGDEADSDDDALTALGRKADVWEVDVGHMTIDGDMDPGNDITVVGFFPRLLTVHVGDTVKWNLRVPFETVTFNGATPSRNGLGAEQQDGSRLQPYAFGNVTFKADAVEATWDGTGELSSGLPVFMGAPGGPPPQTFEIVFTKPGVFEYEDAYHPSARGTVVVVDEKNALPHTPVAAKMRGAGELMEAIDHLAAGRARLETAQKPGVHVVTAGFGELEGASFQRFFPTTLTVKRGDWIVWVVQDPTHLFTVTFAAHEPNTHSEVRVGPAGPQVVLKGEVVRRSPVDVFTGTNAEEIHSGVLRTGGKYAVKIDAPPGMYTYQDRFHTVRVDGVPILLGNVGQIIVAN